MSQYRVHVEEKHDVMETHVYVYSPGGLDTQVVHQSSGAPVRLRYGEEYNGPPTLRIPWEYKDELLDALMPHRQDVDEMVLDTLHREQMRVDQFIEFLTGESSA